MPPGAVLDVLKECFHDNWQNQTCLLPRKDKKVSIQLESCKWSDAYNLTVDDIAPTMQIFKQRRWTLTGSAETNPECFDAWIVLNITTNSIEKKKKGKIH